MSELENSNLFLWSSVEKTAIAYNTAAKKIFGEFAYLNDIIGE